MRIFLIDYENVNSGGLHGIGMLSKEDRVILFYSHVANTLSFEIMDEMVNAGIMPERICVSKTGKNALDFQLVTYLGYLIAKQSADVYYIISKDAGFQSAIQFISSYFSSKVYLKTSIKSALGSKISVQAKQELMPVSVLGTKTKKITKVKKALPAQKEKPQVESGAKASKMKSVVQIQPVPNAKHPVSKSERPSLSAEMIQSEMNMTISSDIADKILNCLTDSNSKMEFHNALQQHFDNDSVKSYYKHFKSKVSADSDKK